jgi:ketopantoate hydroxymethyltransferase
MFCISSRKIPAHLAEKVAKSISIPIGIGAGGVDGQVLVIHDMLGMNNEFSPRFLRRYMNLYEGMTTAIGQYVADVKSSDFLKKNSINHLLNHRYSVSGVNKFGSRLSSLVLNAFILVIIRKNG